jgi:polar amino acid transport system substrate-binding protein
VGKEAALKEFADPNGSFTKGEQYIWAYDFDGINLAHPFRPEYRGQNKLDLADASGVLMIAEMRDMALNGSGFVRYSYANPVTGADEPKLAYVKRVDDTWWIASGIYGKNVTIPPEAPEVVRESLRQKVAGAAAYAREAGREKALTAFNNASGPYAAGNYVFAFDANGTTLAMPFLPERIGRNERDLTDVNGVSIGQTKLRIARNGGGYFYYVFTSPASGKPEFKISYVEPVDSAWTVGAGTYLPDIPTGFSQERRDALVSRVNDAAAYVQKNGREKAVAEFNNPNGSFADRDMFIFAFDRNGTLLANPYLPGIVGLNRLADRDPYGEYPVQQILAGAESGGGFTYWFFADPADDYGVGLKLGYSRMAGDDLVVGAGIFPAPE